MEINSFSENNFTVSPISVLRNTVPCKSFFAQDASSSYNGRYDGNKSCMRKEKEGMKEIQKDCKKQEEIKGEV